MKHGINNPVYRPPAEAYSTIIQIDEGCSHNACTFCGMYKGISHSRRDPVQIESILRDECGDLSGETRIFLADGDVMDRPFDELMEILHLVQRYAPSVRRINTYAGGKSILEKSADELKLLRSNKLHTLYMGLESGDETTLRNVVKGVTAEDMVRSGIRAGSAGLHMSVMVLLGLAGQERTSEHAAATAEVLNRMQPRLLSFLRVVPVPGTLFNRQIEQGAVHQLSEQGVVEELFAVIEMLDLKRTVVRANHSSNIVPVEARLPRERDILLHRLGELIGSGRLDAWSPGPMPFSL